MHELARALTALGFLLAAAAFSAGCSSGNIGSHCSSTGDCGSGLTCYTGLVDGYCSQACAVPGQTAGCSEGICDTVAGAPSPICLHICTSQVDCRVHYNCNGVTNSTVKACRP